MSSGWRRVLDRLGLAARTVRAPRWGLAIDLSLCDGCGDCAAACAGEQHLEPDESWMRLLEARREGSSRPLRVPAPCLHCEPAPCREACPTGASREDEAGLPRVEEQDCTGCGACAEACPIEAIRMRPGAGGPRPGRCDLCAHRLRSLIGEAASEPGARPADERLQGLPACAAACHAGAITFGDLNDPDSRAADRHRRGERVALVESVRTRVLHLSGRS